MQYVGFIWGCVAMYIACGVLIHEHHRKANIEVFGKSLLSIRESLTLIFLWWAVLIWEVG